MTVLKAHIISVVAALAGGAASVRADVVALQPNADATLIQIAPDNSLGGADFFNAGTTGTSNFNRALLYYDLGDAIPAGAIITSAQLSLSVVRAPAVGQQNSIFSLRRMLSSWGEGAQIPESGPGFGSPAVPGEATWNHRFVGGPLWSQPGGQPGVDFSTVLSSTAFVGGAGDEIIFGSSPALVADIQAWLDNPALNFGWMLKTESESITRTARSFAAREGGFGPMLTIEFVTVPEPGVLSLAGIFLIVFAARALRHRRAGK